MRASLLWLAAAVAAVGQVNGFRLAQPLRSSSSSRGRVAAAAAAAAPTTMTMALRPFSLFHKTRRHPQQHPQQHPHQLQLAPTATAAAAVRGGAAAAGGQGCDYKALGKYLGATVLQISAIGGFLYAMEWAFAALNLAPVVKLWVVRLFFAFTSLKSRVFSVLDNSRPSVAREEQRKRERKRPGWMPPPKAFPVIWISIGFLRTIASSLIYETTGTLLCAPILALYLHLSIGDTWNTIASVEDRTGAAVPGVLLVWLSVVNAVRRYHETLPLAGKVLAPSAVWISIAVVLVTNIWWINGKEPLYPVKRN